MDTNTQPQSPAPMTSPVTPVPPTNEPVTIVSSGSPKKVGPIVAVLIIVIILVIAAIYLFAGRINTAPAPTGDTAMESNSQTQAVSQASVQPVTNNSDDVSDLEADLNASTDGLDEQNF